MTNMIGSRGFGKTPGVFEFMPSYLPKGKTAEQVRDDMSKAIKAAAPSYGVFSAAQLNTYSDDHAADQSWKEAIAPLSHIPPATERSVPQFLTRGTNDPLISDAAVKEFVDALVKAGQRAEYVQVGGASHAFFDWKPDDGHEGDIREVRRVLRRGDAKFLFVYAVLTACHAHARRTATRSTLSSNSLGFARHDHCSFPRYKDDVSSSLDFSRGEPQRGKDACPKNDSIESTSAWTGWTTVSRNSG